MMTFINGPLPKKSPKDKRMSMLAKRVPRRIRELGKPGKCVVLYRAEGPSAAAEAHPSA